MKYSLWGIVGVLLLAGGSCITINTTTQPDPFVDVGQSQPPGSEPKVVPKSEPKKVVPENGILTLPAKWIGAWPGQESASCKDNYGHGGLYDHCYDSRIEKPSATTLEIRIPDDMCSHEYYRCRMIDNVCVTVINTIPWDTCQKCYVFCNGTTGNELSSCMSKCQKDGNFLGQ